jgi:hypothetical protein
MALVSPGEAIQRSGVTSAAPAAALVRRFRRVIGSFQREVIGFSSVDGGGPRRPTPIIYLQ